MNQKIRKLYDLIADERKKIALCNHDYDEPFYNPETTKKASVHMGSDIWTENVNFHDVIKPRWTRICKKCGCEDHTEKVETKTKVISQTPVFD